MLTEEQLTKVLLGSSEEIREAILREVKEQLPRTVGFALQRTVQTEVEKFIKESLTAELRAALVEDKPQILAGAVNAAQEIGNMVCEALVAGVKKNLSHDYEVRGLLKALVG